MGKMFLLRLALIPLLGWAFLPGCSKRTARQATPSSPQPVVTVVVPDSALPTVPAQEEPVPPASSVDNAACTLTPPGGMVLIKKRSLPSVTVGHSGTIITHRSPNRSHAVTGRHELIQKSGHGVRLDGTPDCSWHDGYVAVTLPLGTATPRVLYDPAKDTECVEVYDSPLPMLLGGEVVLTNCYDHGTTGGYGYWGCEIERPFTRSKSLYVGSKGENHRSSGAASASDWDLRS